MDVEQRGKIVRLAKLSDETGRYDDMVIEITKLLGNDGYNEQASTPEERALLVRGYRQAIAARRSSLQRLTPGLVRELEEEAKSSLSLRGHKKASVQRCKDEQFLSEYRDKVMSELRDLCMNLIELIDFILLPSATNEASIAACLTLRGDQYRYIAEECNDQQEHHDTSQASARAYSDALAVAHILPAAHPARLAASLNFALLCAQVLKSPVSAKNIAQKAFNEAKKSILHLQQREKDDATPIMDAIQDYIASWESDGETENANHGDSSNLSKQRT